MIKDEINRILTYSIAKFCTIELLVKIQADLDELFKKHNLTNLRYKLSFGKGSLDRSLIMTPLDEISKWALKGISGETNE